MTREVFVAENKGQIVECMLPVLLNHLLQMNVDMGGKKYKSETLQKCCSEMER